MPRIYLSPSTQEFNPYITGGNEEEYMNLIADAMEPFLRASNIQFDRNTPEMTALSSIRQSNADNYDFHIALHSNAAAPARSGQVRGEDIYFALNSAEGARMAEIMVDYLRDIYPLPDRVRALPTTSIGEVTRTRAPAVLVEIAYHDNWQDALWIEENIELIASTLSQAIAQYFSVPFVWPMEPQEGIVTITSGTLNIRSGPSLQSDVIASAQNHDRLTVTGQSGEWFAVNYRGIPGFAHTDYVTLQQ